jgi:predicted TIM-barrel fold metal-dependent hydrolase
MTTIDADAHVIESLKTWGYLSEKDRKFAPIILQQIAGMEARANRGNTVHKEFWAFNFQMLAKDKNVDFDDTSQESRELGNVAARLRHMNELNIDVQILYPTIFLLPGTRDAQAELALHRSYNRWLADIWKASNNRLRWAALAPLYSMNKVHEELTYAKAHGACSIFMRPMECERHLNENYFYPLYEIANDLELAITIHAGNGSFQDIGLHSGYNFISSKLSTVASFHGLLEYGIPSLFPKIRWGFIEAGAGWIPYALSDVEKRCKRRGRRLSSNPLKDNNMFVTCEVTDDIAYIISRAGDENLVIGTDYGHTDTSAQIEALRLIRENGTVASKSVDKILGSNAAALYGLN